MSVTLPPLPEITSGVITAADMLTYGFDALEVAAQLVESRCDMPEELAAIERSKAAAEDGDDARQLSALRHWSTVSLYNSVFRRVAADIRAVKAPTAGAKP